MDKIKTKKKQKQTKTKPKTKTTTKSPHLNHTSTAVGHVRIENRAVDLEICRD